MLDNDSINIQETTASTNVLIIDDSDNKETELTEEEIRRILIKQPGTVLAALNATVAESTNTGELNAAVILSPVEQAASTLADHVGTLTQGSDISASALINDVKTVWQNKGSDQTASAVATTVAKSVMGHPAVVDTVTQGLSSFLRNWMTKK